MRTPNEFWLQVHVLLQACNAEGSSASERAANVCDELLRTPPIVQRELLSELQQLLERLADLYPAVLTAVNADPEEKIFPSRAG